ncbi:PREDICTED: uncharacterized protein LOC106548824, partial [Thamnophis sirtalis]|uniref:ribonuclease H n=1 Tax=Thamnophis sirtalis TaxID=35019 RepID=A0A6I9YCJ7_9SAUR
MVFRTFPPSRDLEQCHLMSLAIQHLLDIRVVEPVLRKEYGLGLYSNLFVVLKSSGGWRAILDLKRLNSYLVYRHFKMSSLRSILLVIQRSDFMASVDLTEAYLHIPILPAHHRFLRFSHKGHHLQYRALLFGLASASRTFTKVLAALVVHLRSHPVRLQCYLDDMLVQAQSRTQAIHDLNLTIQMLQSLGFFVNFPKSHLSSMTKILHLGTVIDSVAGLVRLFSEHLTNLQALTCHIRASQSVSILTLARLLGKMVLCIGIVPWVRLHSQTLQWLLIPYQCHRMNNLRLIGLPLDLCWSLRGWISLAL